MDEPKNVFKNVKPNSWFTYILLFFLNSTVWFGNVTQTWVETTQHFYFILFYYYLFI